MSDKRFGIKEVADVTFYELGYRGTPGKPVICLDTLKVSNIEQTAEQSDAVGGKGNTPLLIWDHSKEINLTLQDALLSTKTLEMIYGDAKQGVITISANTFPKAYFVEGTTFARDMQTGKDGIFKFVIPKAKIVSENTITMEAEGDPTVFDMKLRVLRSDNGVMMRLVGETTVLQYTPLEDGGCEVSCNKNEHKLTDLIIPDSYNGIPVRAIADGGFINQATLQTAIIPSGVQEIGWAAFEGCASLGSIVLPDTLEIISDRAFGVCGMSSIFIPRNVYEIAQTAFDRSTFLEEIVVDNNSIYYSTRDGALYDADSLMKCPEGKNGHLKVWGAIYVGKKACQYCEYITSVEILDAEMIKSNAFSGCISLTSVQLGDVRQIDNRAFADCESLTSIVIPAKVSIISGNVFEGCEALEKIYVCKPQDSIAGAPWGAPEGTTIVWNYTGEEEN